MNTGTPASANTPQRPPQRARKGRGYAKQFTAALLAAFVLAVVAGAMLQAAAPSALAAPITLIKNTGQATHATTVVTLGTGASDDSRAAQSFTTGTNTDGYIVSAIGIKLATLSDATNAGTDLKLELYSEASSTPDSAICTLSDPATFTADAVNEFAAPTGTEACPRLLRNTVYYVVLERVATTTANSTVTVSTTANNQEDMGGATGWSVGDNAQKYATAWAAVSNNSMQVEVKGEAFTNTVATGKPGIVDQAKPTDSLTTVRPGMTLEAGIGNIEDNDGLTTPNWMYQWAYYEYDGFDETITDISGATASTYLLEEKDIDKPLLVKVTFTDDLMNAEGPLESLATKVVGPLNLIVSNTDRDPTLRFALALTATTSKLAQRLVAASSASTFTLDFIELQFGNIGNTATIGNGIAVTLNEDSSGSPGGEICTLENPATFSSSGGHKFYAPTATISTLCPKLETSNTYHVVVEKDTSYTENVTINLNLNKGTHGASAHDWTIPDAAEQYTASSSTWADHALDAAMVIDVRARLTEFELAEITETEVPFGWALTPTGVTGGQKFRLLFLTDDESPTSTDIDVYNAYVQAQAAAGHADIQEHASQFRVLGSTADDDARDNTETTSSDTDAPIYWLNGAKVADNYADLYDGTWDEEANRRTAAGDLSTDSDIIWTGSDDDGTARTESSVSVALGETSVRQGEMDNSSSTMNPLSASTVTAATNTAPFYALSGIFRVEPNTEATINPLVADTLAVKSNPRVGDEIYTDPTSFNSSNITDPEGVPNSGFQIQWFRYHPATDTETEIEGATDQPYFVTHTDADHQLSFTVSFTDNEGNPEVLVSERSEPVLPYDVLLRNKPGHDEVAAPLNATVLRYAQKFNTGHGSSGYHVESIGFHLSQVDNPATAGNHLQVRLLLPDDGGNPDRAICTLSDPATFSAPGMHHFTNPPDRGRCPNLERNTDYFAVIYRTVTSATDIINVTVTTETDEADASSQGWTIEDASLRYTNNDWEDSPSSHRAVIEVKGDRAREITIPIDSPLIPDGLSGGSFRLIFIANTDPATGGDILRYQANLSDALADASDGTPETLAVRQLGQPKNNIRLVVSTDEVDARDNTFSTYTSSHKGVPIFWYKGAVVADDYEDFYDGGWQNENQPRDWHGDPVTDLNQEYWTGSDDDGTAKTRGGVSKALGQSAVEAGKLNEAGSSPLSHAAGDPTESKSMYAITGIFKIENHPAEGLPSITGVPRVGETLTADTSAITDENGTDNAIFTYQWFKVDGTLSGPIAGATSKTFTPTADLAGKQINIDVHMTDDRGYGTPFQSVLIDPTEPIQPTDLIVENTAVGTPTTGAIPSNSRQAQGFTASGDADPFTLTDVHFRFGAVDDPAAASTEITVTLNEDSSGFPGDVLCTLTNPASIAAAATSSFSAPDSCPVLTPGQKYHLVLERNGGASGQIDIYRTTTDGQNPGSAPGWSLNYPISVYNQGSWVTATFQNNLVIDIRGTFPTGIQVPQGWSLTPSGLTGGQKFRLLFITLTGHSSANTDIEGYNTYVKSQANASNAHMDIKAYDYWFRVLGSTADVDARDNTRTNPNDYASVPIYWMGGDKVADNYGDFYDGSWDNEEWTGPTGTSPSSTQVLMWTGSENNGTEAVQQGVSRAMGSTTTVRIGTVNGTGDPLSAIAQTAGTNHRYYALSNIFVAPNSDATGQPAITGTPRVNETLTADTSSITDPEGTGNANFTYQWIRIDDVNATEGDITGATGSTYRPKDEDADKKLKVRISFTDNQGFEEGPLVSEPTATIVPADVLVRNTSRTSDSSQGLTNSRQLRAQAFTTGAAEEGYNLDAIGFLFNNIASATTAGSHLTATLNEETSGDPGNVLCTLTDPTSFTSSGLHSFTAPTSGTQCPTLTANTTYFAVINRVTVTSDAITLQLTNSSGEDPGSVAGFSVGNDRHHSQTGTTWSDVSGQSYQIEVKGDAATDAITSDHTTWVDNRRGDADTAYENLGSYSIAQGFRTGDTVGIYEVHEIHIDFDSGQPTGTVKVSIVESNAPGGDWEFATPTDLTKGGTYAPITVETGGVHTFARTSGNSALKSNTSYFVVIESTSNDPAAAAVVSMTDNEAEDSGDGWTVDDYSHSRAKQANATWTRQEHQVSLRISGSYRNGIGTPGDSYAYESCPEVRRGEATGCTILIVAPEPADPSDPASWPKDTVKSGLVLDSDLFPEITQWWTGWWTRVYETLDFQVSMHPLPTGADYVTLSYRTTQGSARDQVDFFGDQGSLRFDANGPHSHTVSLRIKDDAEEDSGEYMHFSLYDCRDQSGNSCDHLFVDDHVKGIIYNTEESKEISYLRVSDVTVTEGEGATAQFTVSLTSPVTAGVSFEYTTEDGTARDGTDYTGGSGTAFIGNGDTSVTISVDIANDDTWTGDRSFTLKISDAVYAAISDDTGKATIRDDDPQPLTASFTNLPSGHDGESSFTFNISFNQDVATKYLVMQNDAMTVTNGEVTGAERVNGARDFWKITTRPVDGRDVTVELPATTDCSATGAVCTGGDNPQPLSNGITHTFPGTQLNAEFEGFDYYHDGSTPMQFRLVFSKEVDTTAAEIKDHALTVTGATINTVVQKDEDSTRRWNVTVRPAGTGPFDVILASATDCALDGHICTADGELLARGDWKRSSGPPVISVADAAVTEGDGAQLDFAVTLDRYWSGPVPTVSYATSDGTASAGSDYTAGSGSLTLGWINTGSLSQPWTLTGTITVPVANDTVVEETETLTLTLSSPVWATLGDAVATGTIEEDDVAVVREPDSAPTGLPTITGAPEADSALTADTSAIDDANGLTGVSYSYQWIVTTSGTDADVGGATASTYTPRAAHVGKTFKVRVSFTDDDDYQHTLTSEPTTPITRNTDAIVWSADMLVVEYTAVSIGAASADLFSNIGGAGNLQIKSLWSHVPDKDLRLAFTDTFDDAEDHSIIVGDITLEFPAGSSGEQSFKWTNVDLDWTDGETIAVSIVPTTPAEPTPNTTATGEPTISGTPQVGERLTADTSAISDTDGLDSVSYNYQWLAADANIQHATGSTHTLTDDEVGKTIKVKVSFTDDAGNAETLTSQATTAVAPPPNRPATGAPSIQGVLQDQQALSADTVGIADADGLENATISYQWMRVADGDAVDITGATSSTYTLTSTDVGDSIQIQVAFTDDRDNTESITSAVTEAVIASGATRELLWLSTMTPEDPDGLDEEFNFDSVTNQGSLSPAAFTDGADTRAITFLGASVGSNTTLALELGSEPTTAQTATWRLELHDTELAFADATMTQTGASPPAYRFQWDATALAAAADLWDDGDAFTVSLLEAINLSATGVPTIDGTPQVGETLTAAITGITDGNGLDGVSYAYQWTAGGSNIDGATGSSLTLTSSQEGQTIQVRVSFNDDDGFSETATSVATDAVAAAEQANNPATGLPSISGTPQVEQTLTADTSNIDDEDGLDDVAYSYQWLSAGTAISGATGSSYTLTANEQGDTIQVRVDFEDDAGNSESLTSVATDPVAAAKQANTAPTGLPTISGTPQVGQTLTADTSTINDGNGLTNVSYRYQWVRNDGTDDADIAGGTGSTYTLVDADEGRTIRVKVTFTDDADNDESLTSAATETVLARANRAAAGAPTISGTPQVEQTLTADTSGISDEDGLDNVSYDYQWLAGGAAISAATGSSYTLTANEQGDTIQVRVDFTDDAGNSESLTSVATDAVAAKPVPLTATFSNVPDSHSGSGEFTFDLTFSENFPLSYRTLRDHAFIEDDHGPVTRAQRKVQGSNQTWTITVEPSGNGAITITLPATTDCNATGAICTDDGRKLSNSTTITISGPE